MLFRDGSYLTQTGGGGHEDSGRQTTFGQESFGDEPFLLAGVSFPIGPQRPVVVDRLSWTAPIDLLPVSPLLLTEPLTPDPETGRVTIPGLGDVEIVVPEGNPWMVVAMGVLLLSAGVFVWFWKRGKVRRKKK